MAKELITQVPVRKDDIKALNILTKQGLEKCLILIDRAISFLKSGDYQKAALTAYMTTVIGATHFKKRTRDATQVLGISLGIIRAAVAHAEVPPALEFLASDMASRCHGEETLPCLLGPSPEAQEWISKKIPVLVNEGYPLRQAVAIAHAMARKRGYRVPRKGMGCDDKW